MANIYLFEIEGGALYGGPKIFNRHIRMLLYFIKMPVIKWISSKKYSFEYTIIIVINSFVCL